jgi:hypothetical protein
MKEQDVTDWLLEGPAWIRYAVESQLLDLKSDVQSVLQDGSIERLVGRLKNNEAGIPALKTRKISFDATGKAFWDLFFLADIGLTVEDLGLHEGIEEFFGLQLADATFKITEVDEPNYFCVSAIFLSSVAKIGYRNDPRLKKYLQHILDTQRPDGGWHCGQNHLTGEKVQPTESCPMDNLNILMLVGQYEEYRKDSKFNGACDLLLDHWTRKGEKWRPSDFGIGKRFMRLEYPSVKYGILRVLDVLSMFPYAARSESFKSMLDFVSQKSPDGRYRAESVHEAYGEFDFGQMEKPSRWLTFLIGRIEKLVGQYK